MSASGISVYISESTVPRGMRIQVETDKNAMIVVWGDTADEALDRFERLVMAASNLVIAGSVEADERFQKIGANLKPRRAA